MNRTTMGLVASVLAASMALSTPARAQSAPPPGEASAPASQPSSESTGSWPNWGVFGTGILSLGVAYGVSAAVASGSPQDADGNLAFPVIGPWIDIASRPQCGPGSVSCRTETLNVTMLVVDGLVQTWGLAAMAVGLVLPERAKRSSTAMHVAPVQMGTSGYGLMAVGSF